jgi:hypothetical protein
MNDLEAVMGANSARDAHALLLNLSVFNAANQVGRTPSEHMTAVKAF